MSQQDAVTVLLACAKRHAPVAVQLGLERVVRLLADLGDPQQMLNVVHVAGTNGKGSVLAFMEAILRQAGYPVGLYTSPHLQRFNERIVVNGKPISDDALRPLLQEVLAVSKEIPTTFFELTTAVALHYFSACGLGKQGLVLLETGLGGRLDATNVVSPKLSIITAIGIDHSEYLGTTLEAIAREKAGIFKNAVPAVAAPGHPGAERVLVQQAAKTGTPLALLGRDFNATYQTSSDNFSTWSFQAGEEVWSLPVPTLLGRHQLDNAAVAVAGIRSLQRGGWSISQDAISAGLKTAHWPGRLERFTLRFSVHTPSLAILLDGAHNPHACLALARFLDETRSGPNVLIFSALQDKDAKTMATILAPQITQVWTTQVGEERGRSATGLADIWRGLDRPALACATPEEAFWQACESCVPGGQVVVCGSFYLVGVIRVLCCRYSCNRAFPPQGGG